MIAIGWLIFVVDFLEPNKAHFEFNIIFLVQEVFLPPRFGKVSPLSFGQVKFLHHFLQHGRAEVIELLHDLFLYPFCFFYQIPEGPSQFQWEIVWLLRLLRRLGLFAFEF